jgi:hypothetical protein
MRSFYTVFEFQTVEGDVALRKMPALLVFDVFDVFVNVLNDF